MLGCVVSKLKLEKLKKKKGAASGRVIPCRPLNAQHRLGYKLYILLPYIMINVNYCFSLSLFIRLRATGSEDGGQASRQDDATRKHLSFLFLISSLVFFFFFFVLLRTTM